MPAAGQIVIVGLMASGKTTVGRRLAERLGRPFVDNDDLLAASTGRAARDIAAAEGTDRLHTLERDAFRRGLAEHPGAVLAAPASLADWPDVRRLLEGVQVVWLDAPVATLADRAGGSAHRPLPPDDVDRFLGRQAERRRPVYAELADVRVEVDHLGPDEAVEGIVRALG